MQILLQTRCCCTQEVDPWNLQMELMVLLHGFHLVQGQHLQVRVPQVGAGTRLESGPPLLPAEGIVLGRLPEEHIVRVRLPESHTGRVCLRLQDKVVLGALVACLL